MFIGFCGSPASGKSTLSRAVAAAQGWPRVGFGDYVRAEAQRRMLPETREVLQDLGAALIAQDVDAFCRRVLAQAEPVADRPLIIDGIRHTEVVRVLRRTAAPRPLLLVYVGTDEDERASRLAERGELEIRTIKQIDAHSTEMEVSRYLAQMSDLLVDGTAPIPDTVRQVMEWLRPQADGWS